MATMAKLVVEIAGDAGGLHRTLDKSEKGVSRFVSGVKGRLQTLGKISLGALATGAGAVGAAVARWGPRAVGATSDLDEAMTKVNVVFGGAADSVVAFSESTASSMGIAQSTALETAGTFGNLFTTMGLGQGAAADMSTELVGLSSDLASFNNLAPTEVLEKMRSGLVGEVEPLRSLGINLTMAATKAKAMEMGLVDANGELSEAAKLQARYALIVEQSANAQGDFARTSDGLANTQRVLKATWQDTLASIGRVLLPLVLVVLQKLQSVLTGTVLPAINRAGEAFQLFYQYIQGGGEHPLKALQIILEDLGLEGLANAIGIVVGKAREFWAAIQPVVQQVETWISKNVEVKDALIGLGVAMASVIVPALAPIVGAIAGIVATFALITAAVAALRTAWETDWAGIRTALTNFWEGTARPALSQLVLWLRENIPVAIAKLKELWTGTLQPAIAAFAGFVKETVIPVLSKMTTWLQGPLPAAVETTKVVIEGLRGAFDSVRSAIDRVVSKVKAFAGRIRSIEIPDWLKPGSPPPLAIGLGDIAREAGKLARAQLPALRHQFGAMGVGGSGNPTGVGSLAAVGSSGGGWIGDIYINGAQDPEAVARAVIRALQDRGIIPHQVLR